MRRTMWNDDLKGYAIMLEENEVLNFYEDKIEQRFGDFGPTIIKNSNKYIGGNIIELLAEYEDTGLTPDEINQLKYVDIKNLKAANDRLLENNNEYFREYQKLLDENDHLKALLRRYLDEHA